MAYDYKKALQAGATEDQVLDYLNKTRGYNVQGALQAGAKKSQVIEYLANTNKPSFQVEEPKKDVLGKTTSIVNKIFPGKQVGESIGTLAGFIASPNKDQFDLSAPTPLQVAGDIAKGAATVGVAGLTPAVSILGKSAQFGALGAVSGAGEALIEEKPAQEVAEDALKSGATSAAVGAAFGLAGKGFKALSNFLGKTGERIQTSVIKPSVADVKDGFKIETVNKYNLGGSLKQTFEKTDLKLDSLSKELNTKLATNKAPVDLNSVYERTVKKLFGNKMESFGSNSQMESAVDKLRQEIVGVAGGNGLVSIPEAQLVKRASGHFGAWTFGVPTPEATASQKVYNTFYNELKTEIEKASPEGVRQINKQISELIPVMNALIRRIPVAERNATLSLTDIITLSAASLEPRALSLSLLNLASKSGSVGKLLSKTPVIGDAVNKLEPLVRSAATR